MFITAFGLYGMRRYDIINKKDGTLLMKNNSTKFLALLLVGCVAFSGCGAQENTENKNTAEEASTGTGTGTEDTTDTEAQNGGDAAVDTDVQADADGQAGADVQTGTEGQTDTDTTEGTDVQTDADSTANSEAQAGEYDWPDADKYKGMTAAEVMGEAPATSEPEEITGEEHTLVGIITDATRYSVTIQTPDGNVYSMTIPETGVEGNLNYITIGQLATLTYVGSLDENHAALTAISDSSMVTGIYVEEYAFALKIIKAVKSMDMEGLSDLTNFPVFIDTGNYKGPMNTPGEFEAISNEKIFTEALVERMANYNLFDLKYTDGGFVMGNGAPSITFDIDDGGILGIIGITSAAPKAKDDTK